MWDTKIVSPTEVEIISRNAKYQAEGKLTIQPTIGSFYCPKIDLRRDAVDTHLFIIGLDESQTHDFISSANIDLYVLRQALEFTGEVAKLEKELLSEDIRITFKDDSFICIPNTGQLHLPPVAPAVPVIDTSAIVPDKAAPTSLPGLSNSPDDSNALLVGGYVDL